MDPNALLADIRDIIYADSGSEDDCISLVGKVQDLDEWLSNGGFRPDAWFHESSERIRLQTIAEVIAQEFADLGGISTSDVARRADAAARRLTGSP